MEGIRAASHLAEQRGRNNKAIYEVARLLGRLHDTGFTHRDLKPTNLLFDPEGRAYLIDLEGLRTMGEVSDAQAVVDLSKLARRMIELATLSPFDAATFLQDYCTSGGTVTVSGGGGRFGPGTSRPISRQVSTYSTFRTGLRANILNQCGSELIVPAKPFHLFYAEAGRSREPAISMPFVWVVVDACLSGWL